MERNQMITIMQIVCIILVLFGLGGMFFYSSDRTGDAYYLSMLLNTLRGFGISVCFSLAIIALQLFKIRNSAL